MKGTTITIRISTKDKEKLKKDAKRQNRSVAIDNKAHYLK